jgi:hypothetical protein
LNFQTQCTIQWNIKIANLVNIIQNR